MNITGYSLFIKNALKYGFSLFGVPKTGQVVSYVANDDGAYQKGYPKTGDRFVDNGDGTITDNATGLMLKQVSLNYVDSWADAISYAENLNFAGYSDWRLPNVNELLSLIDASKPSKYINIFFTVPALNICWSSTTLPTDTAKAFVVNFNTATLGNSDKLADVYGCFVVRQG